jgi:hypothetical protein
VKARDGHEPLSIELLNLQRMILALSHEQKRKRTAQTEDA